MLGGSAPHFRKIVWRFAHLDFSSVAARDVSCLCRTHVRQFSREKFTGPWLILLNRVFFTLLQATYLAVVVDDCCTVADQPLQTVMVEWSPTKWRTCLVMTLGASFHFGCICAGATGIIFHQVAVTLMISYYTDLVTRHIDVVTDSRVYPGHRHSGMKILVSCGGDCSWLAHCPF